MAGLGSACSHTAAVLFKLEAACDIKRTENSPTSELCAWKRSKKNVQSAPLQCMNFCRVKREQLPQEIEKKKPKTKNYSTKNPFLGTKPLLEDEMKENCIKLALMPQYSNLSIL